MRTAAYVVVVALVLTAAAEATRFAIRYSRVNWRRTPEGRHLMGLSRVLAIVLWGTLLAAAVPIPFWVAAVEQVLLFGWLAYELNRRNRLFTARQREARAPRP